MKQLAICILLVIGIAYGLHAQDKIVLRNGTTIEVHVQRSLENRVEYTYPGESSVYERPKSAISYILYEDGRKEIYDDNLRSSSDRTPPSGQSPANRSTSPAGNKLSSDNKIFWQDVKTTFSEADVRGMTRLKRISAISNISYKDAVEQLKKKAAAAGGTNILVMDVPENENDEAIEVVGIAYRDENMQYTQRSAGERTAVPAESSSNVRRRRIAQQMESYDNESNLQLGNDDQDNTPRNTRSSSSRNTSSSSSSRDNRSSSRQTSGSDAAMPDAVYLTNGRIIRGVIEEFEPDDFVSIRIPTGKIYEYSMDDVKRISRGVSARNGGGNISAKQSSPRRTPRSDDDYEYNDNRRSSSGYDDDYGNYRISGYKGTFDAGYDFPLGKTGSKGNLEINTSHGLQINEFLFAGAGLGLHMYNARDAQMRNSESYPQYVGTVSGTLITPTDSVTYMHAVDSSFMTLPLFLDVRGYYPIPNSAITPLAMFRVGYAFNLSDGFGGMGIYMNSAVGVKYQISPRIGINISIGYSYQNYGGIPANGGYGYYYYKSKADRDSNTKYEAKAAGGISLKLGVEF
ncbi:MAG: hypothetical protein LBC19_02130 [Tannerella sp.]|jgi:hypothetical protein|nr:hypothetical protein [Tannerella sp.]